MVHFPAPPELRPKSLPACLEDMHLAIDAAFTAGVHWKPERLTARGIREAAYKVKQGHLRVLQAQFDKELESASQALYERHKALLEKVEAKVATKERKLDRLAAKAAADPFAQEQKLARREARKAATLQRNIEKQKAKEQIALIRRCEREAHRINNAMDHALEHAARKAERALLRERQRAARAARRHELALLAIAEKESIKAKADLQKHTQKLAAYRLLQQQRLLERRKRQAERLEKQRLLDDLRQEARDITFANKYDAQQAKIEAARINAGIALAEAEALKDLAAHKEQLRLDEVSLRKHAATMIHEARKSRFLTKAQKRAQITQVRRAVAEAEIEQMEELLEETAAISMDAAAKRKMARRLRAEANAAKAKEVQLRAERSVAKAAAKLAKQENAIASSEAHAALESRRLRDNRLKAKVASRNTPFSISTTDPVQVRQLASERVKELSSDAANDDQFTQEKSA